MYASNARVRDTSIFIETGGVKNTLRYKNMRVKMPASYNISTTRFIPFVLRLLLLFMRTAIFSSPGGCAVVEFYRRTRTVSARDRNTIMYYMKKKKYKENSPPKPSARGNVSNTALSSKRRLAEIDGANC